MSLNFSIRPMRQLVSEIKIFDMRMNDGSRNFADLPEIASFAAMRNHVGSFEDAVETEFVTDEVIEMWLYFDYRGHRFSVNNQHGDYWFFVDDPTCPEPILVEVMHHFAKINQ